MAPFEPQPPGETDPPANLWSPLAAPPANEVFQTLLAQPGVRIERIVSTGQASPPDFWYDQDEVEWVALLQGEAGLEFAGEAAVRHLRTGDYLTIPAHCRHRVAWTSREPPAIWLAVFVSEVGQAPRA